MIERLQIPLPLNFARLFQLAVYSVDNGLTFFFAIIA